MIELCFTVSIKSKQLYFTEAENNRLQNDPSCGLTTGGREECWWTCDMQNFEDPLRVAKYFQFITDPTCLEDCYPEGHCLSSLLADFRSAGGICAGSFADLQYPGLFPGSVVHSHWSRNVEACLSLVESNAAPPLLCNKEPAP